MEYINLQKAVDALSSMSRCSICIHDVSGILRKPVLSLKYENRIHSGKFCDLAKSTQKGYDTCVHCKSCANRRAVWKAEAFGGMCAYGLYEMVKPVIIEGRAVCIIYLGNLIMDQEKTGNKLKKTCTETGAPCQEMEALLENCVCHISKQQALLICEFLDSYIRMLYEKYKDETEEETTYHWAVEQLKLYVDNNYHQSFTLESVCSLYFINEKYAGSLFKKQMGMTFHEYLNQVRLKKAAEQLPDIKKKVIDIAVSCGFNNVTYFNKKFMEYYGQTPGAYRRKLISV
ncbi:MAG: helix-turn-helix domain-containing protein [Lachnospiraceae bacterium]|nr:helix-turn-helix domain-containing protein [Lachnospiraceae bacterium]